MTRDGTPRMRRRGSQEDAGSKAAKEKAVKAQLLVNQEKGKRIRSFLVRFITTWSMVGVFATIVYGGHIYLCAMLLLVHFCMYKEVIKIGSVWEREKGLHMNRYLNWHFFVVCIYFVYFRALKSQIANELNDRSSFPGSRSLKFLYKYHTIISFGLYMTGFVLFVWSLRKNSYQYQFGQFAWTHLTLMLVVVQSTFIISNIYEGIIWFLLPVMLVICNDVQAYMCGLLFGRTPLIKLSPKKTWEGFVGGGICTILFAFVFARFLAGFEWLICPKEHLVLGTVTCAGDLDVFTDQLHHLPATASHVLSLVGIQMTEVTIMPIQLHALAFAVFASIVAPFGGFFASGFKRAFKVKDFGDTIPGHGGFTDRMDCQVSMGLFAYIYITTFIIVRVVDPSLLLKQAMKMNVEDQVAFFHKLQDALMSSGALGAS